MRKGVWFGTRENMGWVPAPSTGGSVTDVRWRDVAELLNGGAHVRQSATSHRTLSLSWGVQSLESLAPVISALHLPGPYFYVDPLAAISNIVPPYWAIPSLWLRDGPPLVPNITPTRGTITSTNGYHAETVNFTTTSAVISNLEFAIPEGYTLHVGVHGSGTGRVRLNTGSYGALLSVGSTTRTNLTANGPGFATLRFEGGKTFQIAGIIAQILPKGKTPVNGGFLPGAGFTALQLADNPMSTDYSAVLPNAQRGLAADFVEVGAWSA